MVVIERWEGYWLGSEKAWTLVYGRRKTGKTFLLKRYVGWDAYYTVGRSGYGVMERGGSELLPYREGLKAVIDSLRSGDTVVIDEFQRLPEWAWDWISSAAGSRGGRLVLCGSSVGIVSRVFDRRSPLLGALNPFRVDLASPSDAVRSLSRHLPPSRALLWSVLARDPWLLGLVEPSGDPDRVLADKAHTLIPSAAGLIGEVFREEERELTRLYDATLRMLAQGYWSAGAVALKLHEAGLIDRPQASHVTGILDQLVKLGLAERLRLWRTRHARVYYRHRSSLLSMLMYVEERYPDERPPPETIRTLLGVEAQFFVGELLAEVKGLSRAYHVAAESEVDIVLMKGSAPVIGYEVKLGPITPIEARRAAEKLKALGIPRVGLVSLSETPEGTADEAFGPDDLVEMARRYTEERISKLTER
ncbi:MAG: ATP-binding protein [Thermofilaceae archaeon]